MVERNKNSPSYRWLLGLEPKNVHCFDGVVREMTFPQFIEWLREYSRQ